MALAGKTSVEERPRRHSTSIEERPRRYLTSVEEGPRRRLRNWIGVDPTPCVPKFKQVRPGPKPSEFPAKSHKTGPIYTQSQVSARATVCGACSLVHLMANVRPPARLHACKYYVTGHVTDHEYTLRRTRNRGSSHA